MTTRLLAVGAVLATLLLVPVVWLGWLGKQQVQDTVRYQGELQQLTALTHRLPSEIAKARAGAVGHYDGLVQTEAGVRRKLKLVAAVPPYLDDAEQVSLGERLKTLTAQVDRAFALADRFKRAHSVLRNSLRYLPMVARQIEDHRSSDPAVQSARLLLNDLIRDTLLLQSWPDEAIAARIDVHLRELDGVLGGVPQREREEINVALAHVRNAVSLGPVVRRVSNELIALRCEELAGALLEHFARIKERVHQRDERYWLLGYAVALVALLLAAAAVITRLLRSEREQRRASAELARTVTALEQERAKQQQLAELKSRFVSMTSHEFRTPLSVILSSSEMLEAYDAKWNAERKADHFGRIRDAALGMTRMLDAILLIGRSDSGMLRFEPRRVVVRELCEELVSSVGQASGQPERIEWQGPEQPLEAELDDNLLRHALENLLSNGLKYSAAPKPVGLEVTHAREALVFRVRDQGIGIPVEDRGQLFETFHRGKNVGRTPGTGLGLAIVKRAVTLHGGQIEVESELGAGTTFTVTIPLKGQTA